MMNKRCGRCNGSGACDKCEDIGRHSCNGQLAECGDYWVLAIVAIAAALIVHCQIRQKLFGTVESTSKQSQEGGVRKRGGLSVIAHLREQLKRQNTAHSPNE